MKLRTLLNVGIALDETTAQVVPMFVKEVERGYAFFNWTSVKMDEEGSMVFTSELGNIKLAALSAIHTADTKPKVIVHHTMETCKRKISEEIEVLIGMLSAGDRVLFCIEADMGSASEEFYKAIGFVAGDPSSETPPAISVEDCGITAIDEPFVCARFETLH